MLIAQHMSADFQFSFTQQLQRSTPHNNVVIAEAGMDVEAGTIYICKGCMAIVPSGHNGMTFREAPACGNSYNPDINTLFHSAAQFPGGIKQLGIILTGIGEDGVAGCKAMHGAGARCITESKHSAIVDGMTARARETIPDIEVMEMDGIIRTIKDFCQ